MSRFVVLSGDGAKLLLLDRINSDLGREWRRGFAGVLVLAGIGVVSLRG